MQGFLAISISDLLCVCQPVSLQLLSVFAMASLFPLRGERGNRYRGDPYLTRNCAEDLLMVNSILNKALKVWEFLI